MKQFELISERKRKNLNQTDLSKMLGLSITQYSKKEKGRVEFTAKEIKKIKDVLQLTPERVDDIFLT